MVSRRINLVAVVGGWWQSDAPATPGGASLRLRHHLPAFLICLFMLGFSFSFTRNLPAQVEAEYNYTPGSVSGPLTPGDAERLRQVQRQLSIQDAIRWQNGLPPAALGLRPPDVPPVPPDYYYGYNPRWLYGWGAYTDSAPQPIGRRQVQTGPNRWESFPVYAAPPVPLKPAPSPPAVDDPPAVPPVSDPTPMPPAPEPLPPPLEKRRGPREF